MLLDVLVVGAGQSGLAAGFFLAQTRLTFALFDAAPRVGDSWRRRYDSLVLFSPRARSALPGLALAGDPAGYPSKDELADYLEQYAAAANLPLATGEGIARLERDADLFSGTTANGRRVAARAVIAATGGFGRSIRPGFAPRLPAEVTQISADTYRNPAQVPPGRVLVVGGGGTGRQIARELSVSHRVSLSTGRSPMITPQRVLGRDVMAWFDALGFLRADKATPKGRFARAHDSFPGLHLRTSVLRRAGVEQRARTVGAETSRILFADGTAGEFDAVIWAAGFRDDASWLQVPGALDLAGNYVEDRGVSPIEGLFYVGRSWQNSRASALLCGVGDDARDIVARVTRYLSRLAR
jgi:putative flavoprotein involved in K+ transport